MTTKRILLVDDEEFILRVLRMQLENAGYAVDTACNGREALTRIKEQLPDLMLTDIEMPHLSGKDLCLQLQQDMPERSFPIIVATSLTEREHREWSAELSKMYFLEKPLSARKLLALLNEIFAACADTEAESLDS